MSVEKSSQSGEKNASEKEPKSQELSSDTVQDLPETQDLQRVIAESKENLASEEIKPLKRRRGRPAKGTKKEPGAAELQAAPAPTPEPQVTLVPILAEVVKIPFAIASNKTRFKGFNLEKEEAIELATHTDKLVARYLPEMSETGSLIAVCLFSFASVTIAKYSAYQEWMEKMQVEVAEKAQVNHSHMNGHEPVKPLTREEPKGPPVSSSSFFPASAH